MIKKAGSDALRKSLCAAILVAAILGPVSVVRNQGRTGPMRLKWAESQAAARKNAAKSHGAAHAKEGGIGSRLSFQEVRQLLSSHNAVREGVGSAPLAWSNTLALYAQEWADHLASH